MVETRDNEKQDGWISESMKVIKAVAHVGVDFGYGVYELEPKIIVLARKLCENPPEGE